MFSLLAALFISIRREEEGGGRGGRWALACAAHQIKQILCKDSSTSASTPASITNHLLYKPLLLVYGFCNVAF